MDTLTTIEINGRLYDYSSPTSKQFRNLYIKSFGDTPTETDEDYILPNHIKKEDYSKPTMWVRVSNMEGFKVELYADDDRKYHVEIYDGKDKLVYEHDLENNWYSQLKKRYYERWRTKVYDDAGKLLVDEVFSLEGKKVFIIIDSSSLGDSLAWMPYCEIFAKKHNCKVVVSSFRNELFETQYPDIEFVRPGSVVNNLHAVYVLGWFYNSDMEPEYPSTIPLQKAATNILGLDFEEVRPRLEFTLLERPIEEKYITIGMSTTAGCKEWSREGGWQTLINELNNLGYKVAVIQKESIKGSGIENVLDWTGDLTLQTRMNQLYHSEFYIGLGSGLSWLAWAMNKHVVMISNFSEDGHEFTNNTTRIKNLNVCNGCWNNPMFKFDKGDWNWCPEHKGTDRQFECHKSISPEMVLEQIKHLLS